MIELPPIPEGDRFKDTSLFRPLGAGQKSRLYECWDDAIYEYARTYGDQRAAEARDQMREECVKVCNGISQEAYAEWKAKFHLHQQGISEGAANCETAIRKLK